MTAPLISIVMPAWGRPEKVARAVASVVAQTFSDWELIVVDDASPLPIAPVLSTWSVDPRIQVLRHTDNQGASAARNTGIDAAKGRFIALLDADDLWLPHKMQCDADFIANQVSDNWFGFGQYWVDSIGGRSASIAAPRVISRLDEYLFVDRGAMQTSSLLIPVAACRQVQFDTSLKRLQDWDFVLRLWRTGLQPRPIPVRATLYDASEDDSRISSQLDPVYLQQWLNERQSWLSERAIAGFLANKLAPELVQTGQRMKAISLLAGGVQAGAISPRFTAIECFRILLGPKAFRKVYKLSAAMKGNGGATRDGSAQRWDY